VVKKWSAINGADVAGAKNMAAYHLGGLRYITVRYCPVCGMPLTKDAWAELEHKVGDIICSE